MDLTTEESPKAEETRTSRLLRYARQFVIVLSAGLISVPSGMMQLWPNVLASHYAKSNGTIFGTELEVSLWEIDLISSVTQIGRIVGYLTAGHLLGTIGRKWSLLVTGVPGIVGSTLITVSVNIYMIVVGRLLNGITIGLSLISLFVYAAEVSDAEIRGALISMCNALMHLGGISNLALGISFTWYYMSLICVGLLLVHILLVCALDESPSFLAVTSRDEDALRVLRKLKGPHADIHGELDYLKKRNHQKLGDSRGFRALLDREHLPTVGLMTGIFFIYGFSGSQVFRINATRQIQQLGLGLDEQVTTIIVISLYFVGNLSMAFLTDFLGRRRCMMMSLAIVAASYLSIGAFMFFLEEEMPPNEMQLREPLAFSYEVLNATLTEVFPDSSSIIPMKTWFPMLCLMCAAFGYGSGISTLASMLPTELFPTSIRPQGTSACLVIGSVLVFISLQCYSAMLTTLTQVGLYLFYGSVSLMGIVYSYFLLVETSREKVG
ncbi:facilitated trehalose transporter Tret1-like [Macrobrachium nipponense]|uniref:facilitated trehalose transporter Tret1-like n=1 Tax=Macrobrachium nipponense TaxID=159736 RepID=UPI0030C7BC41